MCDLLIQKTRGELVESSHRGVIAVVDNDGEVVSGVGDTKKITYWRSAAKPLQVIPLIQKKGVETYNLKLKELAVMCASHAGEDIHTETVRSILTKIGLSEKLLECGVHPPVNREVRQRLIKNNQSPTEIHNNCSGKHAGMLGLAQLMGVQTENYPEIEHPVQQEMISLIAKLTGVSKNDLYLAKDGCGVPVFGLEIEKMAYAYSHFGSIRLEESYKYALNMVQKAVTTHPVMVSGTNKFNTRLMEVMKGKVVAKGGAQGVFSLGLPEKQLGVTIKVEDGANEPVAQITLEVLRQLDCITDSELSELADFYYPKIKNARNEIVGESRPVFNL